MKKSNDTIGNRTRNLPACIAVPQPTAPPRAPVYFSLHFNNSDEKQAAVNIPNLSNLHQMPCEGQDVAKPSDL